MRELARIKRILKLIEKIWNKYPDQRLGQLLINYGFSERDIFNQEDNVTEGSLKRWLEELNL